MTRFVTCASLLLTSVVTTAPPSTADIPGLIQQLGSERFREREAATRALDKVGEPALERLRKAAKDNADAEVRRRAGALVERLEHRLTLALAEHIIGSTLSSAEKGRKLKGFIKCGMARKQVRAILGLPGGCVGDLRSFTEFYLRFDMAVDYDTDMNVRKVILLKWEHGPPRFVITATADHRLAGILLVGADLAAAFRDYGGGLCLVVLGEGPGGGGEDTGKHEHGGQPHGRPPGNGRRGIVRQSREGRKRNPSAVPM
jgi:hypothetical protein